MRKIFIIVILLFLCNFEVPNASAQKTSPTHTPSAAEQEETESKPEPTAEAEKYPRKDGAEMVFIPAGSFIMGTDDENAFPSSRPAHEVTIKDFWIDRYEVSNAQYAKCVKDKYCTEPKDFSSNTRSDYYKNEDYANYPVIHVNQYQAAAYCKWAEKRLPTEAEWEKAARGEQALLYPWGNELPDEIPSQINLFENGDTAPVDAFPEGVSPYGVYNMEGNVWEWTADQFDEFYYSVSPAADPLSVTGGNIYTIRGFSWSYPFSLLEISIRNSTYVMTQTYDLGFRCAF